MWLKGPEAKKGTGKNTTDKSPDEKPGAGWVQQRRGWWERVCDTRTEQKQEELTAPEYDNILRCLYFAIGRRFFAYKLKQVCHDLYGWAGLREPEFYEMLEGEKYREVILPEIGKSPRQIWIDMGTKAVRQHVYEPTWLDYLLKGQHDLNVLVIPDIRFPNEAEAIHESGGVLVKVVRPGFGPGLDVADQALLGYDGWDYVIGGDAGSSESLSRLRIWADRFAVWLVGGGPRPEQSPEDRAENLKVETDRDA